jgi:alpha/beta superfamily hydrolase
MSDEPPNGSSSLVRSPIRSIDLRGPAGRLEALLNTGKEDARYAAVVSHPHPLFGGTMHNKVVYHAMKSFQSFGIPVLRFNFRGAGLSEGKHDNGYGEVGDLRAALDWMQQEYERPILFAGFSFGSFVGLKACCGDERVNRYRFLASCAQPKLFISGTEDEFGPQPEVEAVVAQAMLPAELVMVPGANHFFSGKLEFMQQALSSWIESQIESQIETDFRPAPPAATP